MDLLWYILSAVLMLLGVVGSVVPGLPGPPLGYIGMLILQLTDKVHFSVSCLVIWAFVVVVISILDYLLPIWTTKRVGGSKYGINGSIVGMIIGILFTPIGVIMGTLFGAIIGEMIGGADFNKALKSGFASFIGTMLGTGIKVVVSLTFVIYYIVNLF